MRDIHRASSSGAHRQTFSGPTSKMSRDPSETPRRAIKVLGQTDLVSAKQAAAIFGVTERTVRRWLASGKLPQRVGDGREKKFSREDIEKEVKLDAFELITLTEASELLGRSRRTLLRWIAAGKMPSRLRRGNNQKFRFVDILWLREQQDR
jgi:excisionase family DNA binding protein